MNQVIECTAETCRFNARRRCSLPEIVIRPDVYGNPGGAAAGVTDASETFCATYEPR